MLAATTLLAVLLAWTLAGVLLVVLAAILLASALHRGAAWLSDVAGLSVRAWVLIIYFVSLGSLVGLVAFLSVQLAPQFAGLAERIPQALEVLRGWLADQPLLRPLGRELDLPGDLPGDGTTNLQRIFGAFTFTLGTLSTLVIVAVLTLYLSLESERHARGLVAVSPPAWQEAVRELIDRWTAALAWWLVGRLVSMGVVALLVSAGLAVAGVPLPVTLGVLAGLLSFVPYLGPIVSTVPAVLVALTDSAGAVIWVLVIFSTVQLVESNLLTPQIEDRMVAISPFVLITSQMMMGVLLGVPGIMLATPLVVLLSVTFQVLYLERARDDDLEPPGARRP